jgi:hypothetical protein
MFPKRIQTTHQVLVLLVSVSMSLHPPWGPTFPPGPEPPSAVEEAIKDSKWASKHVWELIPSRPGGLPVPEKRVLSCALTLDIIFGFVQWGRDHPTSVLSGDVNQVYIGELADTLESLKRLKVEHVKNVGFSAPEYLLLNRVYQEVVLEVTLIGDCSLSPRTCETLHRAELAFRF